MGNATGTIAETADSPMICVVTDYVESDLDWEQEQYGKAGIDYRIHQLRHADAKTLIEAAGDANVLVVDQAKITREVMTGLERCKCIIRHGDGFDNLDLDAATEQGIVCVNEPGFWSKEAAEQAFTCALALCLKLPMQQDIARNAHLGTDAGWDLKRVMPFNGLNSLTVGIIGYGKIGSYLSGLYRGVVKEVLVNDPYVDDSVIRKWNNVPVGFDELLARADIISIHTPAKPDTIHLFDADVIQRMKRHSVLVNTARGSIVDIDALADAIEAGHLNGAALDTTDPEPLSPDHRLFTFPNVIITPHLAWYSETALWSMRKQIFGDVKNALAGIIPRSVVNPAVLNQPHLRFTNPEPKP